MGEESDKDTNMQCNAMESKSTKFAGCPLPSVISFVVYYLKYICRRGLQHSALYTNKYFAKQLDFDLFLFRKMKNNTNSLLLLIPAVAERWLIGLAWNGQNSWWGLWLQPQPLQ